MCDCAAGCNTLTRIVFRVAPNRVRPRATVARYSVVQLQICQRLSPRVNSPTQRYADAVCCLPDAATHTAHALYYYLHARACANIATGAALISARGALRRRRRRIPSGRTTLARRAPRVRAAAAAASSSRGFACGARGDPRWIRTCPGTKARREGEGM